MDVTGHSAERIQQFHHGLDQLARYFAGVTLPALIWREDDAMLIICSRWLSGWWQVYGVYGEYQAVSVGDCIRHVYSPDTEMGDILLVISRRLPVMPMAWKSKFQLMGHAGSPLFPFPGQTLEISRVPHPGRVRNWRSSCQGFTILSLSNQEKPS